MENSDQLAPARLWSLDVLRGLCAGIVFLSHWHLWSDFTPRGVVEETVRRVGNAVHDSVSVLTWPTGGHHPAVLGFFVLSGFCIHYPFQRRAMAGAATPVWRDYFRRRFFRIMPVYWAACLLGLAFVAAEAVRPTGSPLLALHAMSSLQDVIVRAIGFAGVYPREIFAGNYILTTVTVEIIMYAAYPLFYVLAGRGRWVLLGLIFAGMHAGAIVLLRFYSPYWVFNSIFMLGLFWYAGALAAHLYLVHRPRLSGKWLLAAWLLFLALKATPYFVGLNLLKQGAWGLVCTLGILWSLRWEPNLARAGERGIVRALRRLGDYSYSLYAMHTPAIMLASWALIHLGLRSYSLQLIVTMTASVLATVAVHFGIERTFYRPANPPPASYSNNISAGSMVT